MTIEHRAVEGPVEIKNGMIGIAQDRFVLSQAKAAFSGCRLEGSLTLEGFLKGSGGGSLAAHGSLSRRCLEKLFAAFAIAPELMPRTPFSFRKAKVTWGRGRAVTLAAELGFGRTVRVGLDLKAGDSGIEIRRLSIADGESQCLASLGISPDILSIAYSGMLTGATLDAVLADNRPDQCPLSPRSCSNRSRTESRAVSKAERSNGIGVSRMAFKWV